VRSVLQPELIRFLEFQRAYREKLEPSAYLRVAGLLASAGFSLWRAAFLFHQEEGDHETYLKNIDRFISKMISDNTIAFTDDKNTWSLWHYMSVARTTLVEALTLLHYIGIQSNESETMLLVFGDPPLLSASAARQWNELFGAMQFIREALQKQLDFAEAAKRVNPCSPARERTKGSAALGL
jgi:hypothetical protein